MPERCKIRGSRFGRGGASPMAFALAGIVFASLIGTGHPAMAAANGVSQVNHKDRQELACKTDIQRFCSEANLKQECLVARWDRISAECRNVLGSSAGNRPGGGS
jgi:hypothetical protein